MKIVGKTDKGFKRPDNQDRFVAGTLENGISFGFVCDGMGGANGGSVASGMLCKTLEEMLFLQGENKAMNAEEAVLDAVSVACAQIYTKAENDTSLKAYRGAADLICHQLLFFSVKITHHAGE